MPESGRKSIPRVLELYLEISQYPILGQQIRERMREELFERGVIGSRQFDLEIKNKAVLSQQREGVSDPIAQESAEVWRQRRAQVRDHLTDFYFAHNLPHSLFEDIVREVLSEHAGKQDTFLSFNPELAPLHLLLEQAKEYEAQLPVQRRRVKHHLEEIIVVLVKTLISDQMAFIRLAKEYLTSADFELISRRRIGQGKIGGKAAGMLLAWKMLQRQDSAEKPGLSECICIPDSYFIGADVFYDFMALNKLHEVVNQKYKTQVEIEAEHPHIQQMYQDGKFTHDVLSRLREVLVDVQNAPLIVRSSSLLEDNFGFSFAGKYESVFCPNQEGIEENLAALTSAIARVYASVFSPDALLYRQKMGLVDYDERMAVLIQTVQGARYKNLYFPTVAGVGFSRNPFRWSRMIETQAGLLRMVCGLGTRAVDRVGNDYPRMVALSHPRLRPEADVRDIRKYSQRLVDVIDLGGNSFKTLPVSAVLSAGFPGLRLLASVDKDDYLQAIYAPGTLGELPLVLTFDELLKNQEFVTLMRSVLSKLEKDYGRPVDMEFTIEITDEHPPRFILHLLQCRPLSSSDWDQSLRVPRDVAYEDVVFETQRMVPHGRVRGIRYVVLVDPVAYKRLPDQATRFELARLIGRLNQRLEGERFILMGPGRWGTSNVELGLKVTYADIHNSRALIEIAESHSESTLEVSYGTHFFQDLVETRIYPLPLYLDAPGTRFNRTFFDGAENVLGDVLPQDADFSSVVKVIDVPAVTGRRHLELVMDGETDHALAFLTAEPINGRGSLT
jgi:hypothetical protein